MTDRTPTAARPVSTKTPHWYSVEGEPAYEVPRSDGKGMRATTLADAKKRNYLPSVTGILELLDKPALVTWKQEQAALAVLTTPRADGEELDKFVYRVLHTEKQQDQEAKIAADKGTLIHDALRAYFQGQPVADDILKWIDAPFQHIWAQGEYVTSEIVLVGEGYAGTSDLLQDCGEFWALRDWKSTKKLPEKGPLPEHRLQLSAYAQAYKEKLILAGEPLKPIKVSNVYISSLEPGKFVEFDHGDWEATYNYGFAPLVLHWQWANNHVPKQTERDNMLEDHMMQEHVKQDQAQSATLLQGASNAPAAETARAGDLATSQNTPEPSKHKSGKTVVYAAGVPMQ